MKSVKPRYAIATVIFVVGILPGCAEIEKCGLEGCASDQKITTNVEAQLSRHPDLGPAGAITVQTLNHVVYLYGMVADGLEKSAAESIARQVPGVTGVESSISVTH